VGAQLSDQVIYPNTSVDDKGEALTGTRKYVLHFDAGKLPPVSVFWNMAMYGVTCYSSRTTSAGTASAALPTD
jgi:hypothetical protein